MNEEDRINNLPNSLLIDIISLLPTTKEAIRIGTLSKRWQHLWPYVSNLIFNTSLYNNYPLPEFILLVDKTLTQCRRSNLLKFHILASHYTNFESQVNNWIRYAVSCNVQELVLSSWATLDQFIFLNSCFTCLELSGCVFNPTGVISWSKLTRLLISDAYLSKDLIQNILSGCPLLETLQLFDCYGYERIDITSKSVKHFQFYGYMCPWQDLLADRIEISAPYIVSLIVDGHLYLWKLLLLDVSSLVKADLDYIKNRYDKTTSKEGNEDMLKAFIQSLVHVKELKIGTACLSVRFLICFISVIRVFVALAVLY
ncbi:F-box/LRR-repeat protein 25-like protein [Tanacetum coccineum]